MSLELIGALIGLLLTLCVFSYVIGDNFLFRLAIHIFIGVAAAFSAVFLLIDVLWAQLLMPLPEALLTMNARDLIFLLPPLVLGALLLFKISPRLAWLGSASMAFLVGVAAATIIGGAVLGTLLPQVAASIDAGAALGPVGGLIVALGTATTLIYFQFSARPRPGEPPGRGPVVESAALVGQGFIAITFGALFAGVYAASVAALVERVQSLVGLIQLLLS